MTEKTEKELYELFENHNSNSKEKLEPDTIISLVDGIKNIVTKNSDIEMIREFMLTFNQIVRNKPTIPPKDECLLRLSLISEETIELAEACGSEVLTEFGLMLYKSSEKIKQIVNNKREYLVPSLVGALDAFKDLQYVTRGSELSFGMRFVEAEAFEEVHSSNMTKVCKDYEEANASQQNYASKNIITNIKEQTGGKYLIFKVSNDDTNNKVLKSINYKPAQLDKFIENVI